MKYFLFLIFLACGHGAGHDTSSECDVGLPCVEDSDCGHPGLSCQEKTCVAHCSAGCCRDDDYCKVVDGKGKCFSFEEKLSCPSIIESCWGK